MSVQRPFDPIPRIAAHLHAKICPGHATAVAPTDCLVVKVAVEDYLAELREAGLALVPVDSVRLLEGMFADTVEPEPVEERDEPPSPESNAMRSRVQAPTWVRMRYSDGRVERDGPYQRWLAELVLADLGWAHKPELVGARLEGEPAWVEDILRELGGQAA